MAYVDYDATAKQKIKIAKFARILGIPGKDAEDRQMTKEEANVVMYRMLQEVRAKGKG